jgi:hypothetical protein
MASKVQRITLVVAALLAAAIVLGVGARDRVLAVIFLALETVAVASFLGGLANGGVDLPRRLRAIRWGSALALVSTILIVGSCSATGVSTPQGPGYALALAAPASYLAVVLLLVGPLLILLALPALLTLRVDPDPDRLQARLTKVVLCSWLSVGGALATSYGGFIASYAIFCKNNPAQATPAQNAACVASSGAIAAFFGILGGILVLPHAMRALQMLTRRG